MISPLEIQEKEFSRGLKGFKEDEVNEFLDQITLDLERLLEENRQLRAERDQMEEELKKYKNSESAVLDTLETAKSLMGDISASAEKRAQILLKNAELEAQHMQKDAKAEIARMKEESATLQNRVKGFRMRYKQLLEAELKHIDAVTEDLFSDLKFEDLAELSKLPEAKPKQQARPRPADDRKKTMVHRKG